MGESEINGVNTEGLKETVGQISKQPELGRCEFRLHNEWVNGDENRSSTCSFYAAGGEQKHKQEFKFQAGEPPLLQGKDNGANPVEFLLSALSGCMTTTITYYSALNGIKIEKMESDYKGELDLQGIFGLDKSVRVTTARPRASTNTFTQVAALAKLGPPPPRLEGATLGSGATRLST